MGRPAADPDLPAASSRPDFLQPRPGILPPALLSLELLSRRGYRHGTRNRSDDPEVSQTSAVQNETITLWQSREIVCFRRDVLGNREDFPKYCQALAAASTQVTRRGRKLGGSCTGRTV